MLLLFAQYLIKVLLKYEIGLEILALKSPTIQ